MSAFVEFLINDYQWSYLDESPGVVSWCERMAMAASRDDGKAQVAFIEDDETRIYRMDPEDASKIRHLISEPPKEPVWYRRDEKDDFTFWLGEDGKC